MPGVGANVIIGGPDDGASSGTPADAILAEDGTPLVTEGDVTIVTEDGS